MYFLIAFLDGFWMDFGVILGSFWEPKSVILGINFLMIFAYRSKSGPRAPKSSPRAPKSTPRMPKRAPRAPEERVPDHESTICTQNYIEARAASRAMVAARASASRAKAASRARAASRDQFCCASRSSQLHSFITDRLTDQ